MPSCLSKGYKQVAVKTSFSYQHVLCVTIDFTDSLTDLQRKY